MGAGFRFGSEAVKLTVEMCLDPVWFTVGSFCTASISLPPEMAAELEEIQKKEHRTRSELIREALRRYISNATDDR